MTKKLAVLIPSRNETYLTPTVESCFAAARGDTEVVVTLEGYWPADWKDLTARYPNLHTVHHGEPRGLRAAVNSAAASAISRGADYLFKLDAHCMLDEGFDVKLLADIESNWIVVPRRKRLDAENWTIRDVGKPDIDYHYLSFPDDPNDFGGPGLNGKVWDQRIKERLNKPEYDIDDEMSSQGSAWCMAVSYFQQLELMDEASYGPFWNEAQELFLKAWLSGGRGVINKKTWYAHLHKSKGYVGTTGNKGRGYTLPESWLQQGATFTKQWIWNEAWDKQTLPFEWLINHFWPVPSWPDNWEERLYATRKPRAVVRVGDIRVLPPEPASATGLVIHSARYGAGSGGLIDVTERLQSLVKNNSLDIIVNNSTLTPGQNPFRGKRKSLQVIYSYDGGDRLDVVRDEKDWLIIGQAQRLAGALAEASSRDVEAVLDNSRTPEVERAWAKVEAVIAEVESLRKQPLTATGLNDYLIRKFQISPQRLRAPMPIELRDFHRNDLAQLFAELGFKRGAEIGVAEGNYSEVLLKANPECELLLVDPWHAYSDNPQNKSKEKHEFAYGETLRKTKCYPNVTIMQDYSMNAVRAIEHGTLDWVYVDANHLFDECIQDIVEWSKRVRSGGLIAGDDFYQLDQRRWRGGGVVEAVQAYVNAHQISPWWIFAGHKSVDFMFVKP